MHITDFSRKNLPAPLGNGVFWAEIEHVIDGETVVQRMLRPDWKRSWMDNKAGWLLDVIQRIQNEGWRYSTYPKTKFANLSHATIERHVQTWFKGIVAKYNPPKAPKRTEAEAKLLVKMNNRKREVSRLLIAEGHMAWMR